MSSLIKPVIHIGPPKTATTSIQNSIIPQLGRPYVIRPAWAAQMCRGERFERPTLPSDVILSDEGFSEYRFKPELIARALGALFPSGGTIIFVVRGASSWFDSYYRQQILNGLNLARAEGGSAPLSRCLSADEVFDYFYKHYNEYGVGPFATLNAASIKAAYSQFFSVVDVPFALLVEQPDAFSAAFAVACGVEATPKLTRDNEASVDLLRTFLSAMPGVSPDVAESITMQYENPNLSPDRRELLLAIQRGPERC